MAGLVDYIKKYGHTKPTKPTPFDDFLKIEHKKGETFRVFYVDTWWEMAYLGDGKYSRKLLTDEEIDA